MNRGNSTEIRRSINRATERELWAAYIFNAARDLAIKGGHAITPGLERWAMECVLGGWTAQQIRDELDRKQAADAAKAAE